MLKAKLLLAGFAIFCSAASVQAFVIDTSALPDVSTTWDDGAIATLDKVLTGMDEEVAGQEVTATLVDAQSWSGWGAISLIL